MAGLFNIFNESENLHSLSLNKGKENSQNLKLAKLKTVSSASSTSLKTFVQPQSQSKPKGLSIRSKSDLNVSVSSHSESCKQMSKDCMSLESKINISKKPLHSPTKLKTPKSKSIKSCNSKKLSPKPSSPLMKNVVNEFVFAKPATPKPSKKYPEPESLANYVDPVKLMDDEMQVVFNADLAFVRSATNNDDSLSSLDDEGFISDPEQDNYLALESVNGIITDEIMDEVELPDISDFED